VKNLIESLDNKSCKTVGVVVGPYLNSMNRYTAGAQIKALESKHDIILTTTNNIIEELKKIIYNIFKHNIYYSFFKITLFILILLLFIYFFLFYINIYLFIVFYSVLILILFYLFFIY